MVVFVVFEACKNMQQVHDDAKDKMIM